MQWQIQECNATKENGECAHVSRFQELRSESNWIYAIEDRVDMTGEACFPASSNFGFLDNEGGNAASVGVGMIALSFSGALSSSSDVRQALRNIPGTCRGISGAKQGDHTTH